MTNYSINSYILKPYPLCRLFINIITTMPKDVAAIHDILLEIRDSLKSIDRNAQTASAMKLFMEKIVGGDVNTDPDPDPVDDDREASPNAKRKTTDQEDQPPTKRRRGRPRKNPEQPPPSPPNPKPPPKPLPKPPPPANHKHTDKNKQDNVISRYMNAISIPTIE